MRYRYFVEVALLIFTIWWCKDVFGRLKSDIAVLKESKDTGDKVVIIFWWFVTLILILVTCIAVWSRLRIWF